MRAVRGRKRLFYLVMGCLALFISSAILFRIGDEWAQRGHTTYGLYLPHQLPALQYVHLVCGVLFWGLMALMGAVWSYRGVAGQEPEGKKERRRHLAS